MKTFNTQLLGQKPRKILQALEQFVYIAYFF